MDSYADVPFHFTGRLSRLEREESISDSNLLGRLKEERAYIAQEIQLYVQEELADELGVNVNVSVAIDFQEGSVLFSGVIWVVGVLASVAGTIDFVEKMARLIRRVLRWVLGRRAPSRRTSVRVLPTSTPPTTSATQPHAPDEGQLFSSRTILLAVTLLNAAIFIGGSVYTGISVTSIQEKYAKAQGEIEKVRQDYDQYRAGLQQRLGDIEGQLTVTGKDAEEAQRRARKLSDDIAALDQEVQELRASVSNRGASWLSLRSAFYQGNWVLKLYLIMVPLCALATLALVARVTGFY